MTRVRRAHGTRSLAAVLALLLSIQAFVWVVHAAEHAPAWRGGALPVQALADAPDRIHVHAGPFARCGACDALAQLQGGALPWTLTTAPLRAARAPATPVRAVLADRFLARANARGPPPG